MFEEQFVGIPAEPPRRVESLPGLRLARIPKGVLLLPLFFVSFFLIIPLSIMNTDPAMRLATGPTDTVQGQVVSVSSASACRGAASHRVVYTFASKAGRQYRGSALLCEESPYYSVKEGDAVEVRYLRSDPTLSALPGTGGNQEPPLFIFLIFPLFFLAFFGAMFWPPIGEVLRARRLFKKGRLATGKVVFIRRRSNFLWPGMPGSSSSLIFIGIRTSSGVEREVVASCYNDWLMNQLAPGATVRVAYTDDKADKVALLDAFVR
jgi:hypothetical protein